MLWIIAGTLLMAAGYFAKRAHDAQSENTELRARIASLKRQLARA
jgi:hypothetical protein